MIFSSGSGGGQDAPRVAEVVTASHALANDERFGIWGGLSERERRRLRRARTA
jgi:WhiB family redox-sensing transcriptional regulator